MYLRFRFNPEAQGDVKPRPPPFNIFKTGAKEHITLASKEIHIIESSDDEHNMRGGRPSSEAKSQGAKKHSTASGSAGDPPVSPTEDRFESQGAREHSTASASEGYAPVSTDP